MMLDSQTTGRFQRDELLRLVEKSTPWYLRRWSGLITGIVAGVVVVAALRVFW